MSTAQPPERPSRAREDRVAPRVAGAAPLSRDEIAADRWAEAVVSERGANLRVLATSWGATVSAITGLFGLGTLADADAVVQSLRDGFWPVAFGILVTSSVAAAAGSLYFASHAAQAQIIRVPAGVQERLRLRDASFDEALTSVGRSRKLALAALVLLALCTAVRWYAPRDAPDAPEQTFSASSPAIHDGWCGHPTRLPHGQPAQEGIVTEPHPYAALPSAPDPATFAATQAAPPQAFAPAAESPYVTWALLQREADAAG